MRKGEWKKGDCESEDNDDAERCEERDVGSCDAREGERKEVDEYCGGVVKCHLFEAEREDEGDG